MWFRFEVERALRALEFTGSQAHRLTRQSRPGRCRRRRRTSVICRGAMRCDAIA